MPAYRRYGFIIRLPTSFIDDEPASKMKFPSGELMTTDWPEPTLRTDIVRSLGCVLRYLIKPSEKTVMTESDVINIFLSLGLTIQ